MAIRKVPQRTCVGCRQCRPKGELVRVVRTPTAEVLVDQRGKVSGRGAYVCANPGCLEKALKSRGLERSLSMVLSPETIALLRAALAEVSHG